ncbi:muscular LMNA-interacting protein isoform X1 [Elgaria multicarinata webbii]|uniref:muscular LMNA-interacting protein isoform X1 n=1 Tax=Elgaria multicarinata webbii TaxID=159646 RepID=UPI002FCD5F29
MGSESFFSWEMELEKHKRGTSARDCLSKEKLKVPSESGFLRFTFVPSFGRLPTQFHFADATKFLAGVAEGPVDRSSRNRTEAFSQDQALGSRYKGEAISFTKSHPKGFPPTGPNASGEAMEGNDLFKAEFVFITDSEEDTKAAAGNGCERAKILDASCVSASGASRGQLNASQLPLHMERPYSSTSQQKHAQIKTSYKAFAAIPTNTLLLEQKALDEPTKAEGVVEDGDTHSEICSPAQLRQQTEELCAAIDQVLQDPLSMHRCDCSPSSLQNISDSDIDKTYSASQRPAGWETRFANFYLSGPAVPESPKTKPGVIRPTMVKAKIIVQEEEPIQPNPFKKYLEETTNPETEEDPYFSHSFFHTKPNPPTKSPLHPQQAISHAVSLTPGPFSHLGSILGDIHDHSYSPYRHNTLHNKPTHPIVPIPENEALSSKELCSVRRKEKLHSPVYEEKKELSKGNFPDNGRLHSRDHCLIRGDLGNSFAKPS